jgi:hypothetical protein
MTNHAISSSPAPRYNNVAGSGISSIRNASRRSRLATLATLSGFNGLLDTENVRDGIDRVDFETPGRGARMRLSIRVT